MHGNVDHTAEVIAVETELARNQDEIDFVVAIIARGGEDAIGMNEHLERLELERGDLLQRRDALIEPA